MGIFLLGLNQLSEGLQAVAGKRLRKIVAACTSNRFAGIVTGAFVTGIVQSSSVVTVMVVGLVTAGVMTLRQAVNVVVGSNIGSTTTAWFVVLLPTKLGDQSMIIIAVAALFYLFAKREKVRYTALASLGIGLVFFGLELMSKGLSPLRSDPGFIEWFHMFDASTLWGVLKCVLMGSLVTAVIQSSAASAAISISLAYNGVISFETAVALVFGMNIGTTITAWLAALTASTEARRAA
ncbi:MAG: Na/Pi symporter, partial [Kiritimatiellae bacterium]|nr:Na/Pi symporter [Kiritimatiellia bacterium]